MKVKLAHAAMVAMLLGFSACSHPDPRPLNEETIVMSVADRPLSTAERLRETLAETGLDRNWQPIAAFSLSHRDAALAHSQGVRRAKRALMRRQAEILSAGDPLPIDGRLRTAELNDPTQEVEFSARADIIGIFGLGPSETARLLAEERMRAAVLELERSAWASAHAADRAWIECIAACRRAEIARDLAEEAAPDLHRIKSLVASGAIGHGPAARATAFESRARRQASQAHFELAERQAVLARATGLPMGSELITRFEPQALKDTKKALRPRLAERSDLQVMASHPQLRGLRREYAVAEAALREAAAARWPRLSFGPRLVIRSDSVLPGGLFTFSIPFPGSLDGPIAAAMEDREAARERLEDAWLGISSQLVSARRRVEGTRSVLMNEAQIIEVESARAFAAAQAQLRIDPGAVRNWSDALDARLQGSLAHANALREHLLALIDLREAGGLLNLDVQEPTP